VQREVVLDDVVQKADAGADGALDAVPVDARIVAEFVLDERGEVDVAQGAGAVGLQRLLAAGVGALDGRAVLAGAFLFHVVPEQDARLGRLVGAGDHLVPQLLRVDRLLDALHLAVLEVQRVVVAVLDGLHELVVDLDADVGVADRVQVVALDRHEVLDVRVPDGRGDHQCAAAAVLADRAGGRREQLHEAHGAAGGAGRVVDRRALGAKRADVDAVAASV
jgi:hypothetical protein